MDVGDVPLMTSWSNAAADLLADELRELESLSAAVAQQEAAAAQADEVRATGEVEAALAQRYPTRATSPKPGSRAAAVPSANSSWTGARPSPSSQASRSPSQRGKLTPSAPAAAAAPSATAERKSARAAERALLLEQRLREMKLQRSREPWRQLTAAYAAVIHATERALAPVRQHEQRELEFFLSRSPESFSMDEITSTNQRHPVAARTGNPAGASSPTEEEAEVGCQTRSRETVAAASPSSEDFIIDAGDFASAYNRTLAEEYGYKPVVGEGPLGQQPRAPTANTDAAAAAVAAPPVQAAAADAAAAAEGPSSPTGLPRSGPAWVREPTESAAPAGAESDVLGLSERLATHRPGPDTALPDFCVSVPGGVPSSAGERHASLQLPAIATTRHAGQAATFPKSRVAASSAPSLPLLGSRADRDAHARRGDTHRTVGASTTRKGLSPSASPLDGIECSVISRQLTLSAFTGASVTALVRFTNRNTDPTRLRLKPADHPWLRFRCARVAPVAGARTAVRPAGGTQDRERQTARDESLDSTTPLSCGGYIEVEVTFTPNTLSEPLVEEQLQVGVTRQRNERSGDGAQWGFLSVDVVCRTEPPRFRLLACAELADRCADGNHLSVTQASDAEDHGDGAQVAVCAFEPTFVLGHREKSYTLRNDGSDCVVTLESSSPCFVVCPAKDVATTLGRGESMRVAVRFEPHAEGPRNGTLTAAVRGVPSVYSTDAAASTSPAELRPDAVLAEHHFDLVGVGVVPRVSIRRVGDMSLPDVADAVDGEQRQQEDDHDGDADGISCPVAKYVADRTTPEVTTSMPVVVVNHSPVGLPFYWDVEAVAGCDFYGDASAPLVAIEPAAGVLPGDGAESIFLLQLTPQAAAPLLASLNMYVTGLPDGGDAALLSLPRAVVSLLQKDKWVPSALSASTRRVSRDETGGPTTVASPASSSPSTANSADQRRAQTAAQPLSDPYAVFSANFRCRQTDCLHRGNPTATFLSGCLVFANPIAPSIELMPPMLEETVDCLAGLAYTRAVVLHNPSPCAVHFVWGPLDSGRGAPAHSGPRRTARDKADGLYGLTSFSRVTPALLLSCEPRSGAIPAGGSATVQVHFTATVPGVHAGELSLLVPELDRGLPGVTVAAGAGSAADPTEPSSRALRTFAVHVTAVGPTVHVSSELLDFGLVEFGGEAEASFTVTNDNPVPVSFELLDPLMRDPPRFVFIPPAFRLAPGDSVEVTVYRKAASLEDAQTYFELVVDNGGTTIAIETRATIQKPTMLLEAATVNFGVVPEDVWKEQCAYLTNRSALDIPFTVEMASPPPAAGRDSSRPCVELELPTGTLWLRAGQKRCPIPLRARFQTLPGRACPSPGASGASECPYRVLLGIRSKHAKRTSTGATANGQVLLLEVSCDAVERLALAVDVVVGERERGCNDLAVPPPVEMPVSAFVKALLTNLVEERVLCAGRGSGDVSLGPRAGAALPRAEVLSAATALPYCPRTVLSTTLADASPVSRQELQVRIRNDSGCLSSCQLVPSCFAALPIVTRVPTAATATTTVSTGWKCSKDDAEGRSRESSRGRSAAKHGASRGHDADPQSKKLVKSTRSSLQGGTASTAAAAAVVTTRTTSSHLPASLPPGPRQRFWTTTSNGMEQRERAQWESLSGAQRLLLDGRGCACVIEGDTADCTVAERRGIGPHTTLTLPVTLLANLPGRYEETLRLLCDGIPRALDLPVVWELRGKPVLLDSTTSGLVLSDDGHDVLVMPPTVAQLGTSRRVLKLANRAPRDVNVEVKMFVSASTFTVVAVQEDVEAARVVLTLGPIPEEQQAADRAACGTATASPAAFLMKAMATCEVALEYVPDLNLVARHLQGPATGHDGVDGDGGDEDDDDDRVKAAMSQEVDWEGSLVVHTALARSDFNDAFLMDEFYAMHRAQYPCARTLKVHHHRSPAHGHTQGARSDRTGSNISSVSEEDESSEESADVQDLVTPPTARATMSALRVVRPLISRPGSVVRNSELLMPLPAEAILIAHAQHSQQRRAEAASASSLSGAGRMQVCDDDDSSQDEDEETAILHDNPVLQAAAASGTLRPVEVLLAEEMERQELLRYLSDRHEALREASEAYFLPIELQLRARCGVPRLAVQPSPHLVLFPSSGGDGGTAAGCRRTIRLTNHNSADLCFTLRVEGGEDGADARRANPFCVVAVTPLPQRVESTPLEDESEEAAHGPAGSNGSRSGATAVSARASTKPARTCRAKAEAMAVAASTVLDAASVAEETCVYNLHGADSLEVTVAYSPPAPQLTSTLASTLGAAASATATSPPAPSRTTADTGTLVVSFVASASAAAAAGAINVPLVQRIPLRAPLPQACVSCSPVLLWFRPGQQIHDGRAQPTSVQELRLCNTGKTPVQFELVPRRATLAERQREDSPSSSQPLARAPACVSGDYRIKEVVHMPDPRGSAEPARDGRSGFPTVRGADGQDRFSLSATQGTIPAATRGGEPGAVTLRATFHEFSNVRFETEFVVFVNGEPTSATFALRGDSRDTEL